MGYEVHIKRQNCSTISLDEWCAAVSSVEGVRLATHDCFATNPTTGENIRISRNEGDVEVYFSDCDAWVPCLRYSVNRISFKPSNDFDDATSPFRRMIVTIASRLNAQVIGDEGEIYT